MRKFWIPVLMAGLFTLGTVSVPSAAQAKIKLGKLLKKRLKKKKRALKKKLRKLFKKKKNGTFLVLADKREKRLLRGGPVDKGAKTKKQKIPGVLKRYRNYLDGKAGEAPQKDQ